MRRPVVRRGGTAALLLLGGLLAFCQTGRAEIRWPASTALLEHAEQELGRLLTNDAHTLRDGKETNRFYQRRGVRLAWVGRDGITHEAAGLVKAIRDAETHGLRAQEYHLATLQTLLSVRLTDAAELARLDLLLTDAFLSLSHDLRNGHLDPAEVDSEWYLKAKEYDLSAILEQALARRRVEKVIGGMPPQQPGYEQLRKALAAHRRIRRKGGWLAVPEGPTLRPGMASERVVDLRDRLASSGDYKGVDEPLLKYDAPLVEAVKRFQRRHGLKDDGAVGEQTLAALNVPLDERIRQLRVNLERWRWLPRRQAERYVLVNMAGYRLDVIEGGRSVMQMRVIVGRDYRQTPSFASQLTSVVVNPYWYVPQTIFREDILPLLRSDASYLQKAGLRVFQHLQGQGEEVDARTIDWNAVEDDKFPYTLRQDAGPGNALGRLKFMLPNPHGIFLHDTNDRSLFERSVRALSSGCIRLEEPEALAEYLLRGEPGWSREGISASIESGRPRTVTLPKPFPVYLVYFTAWVGGEGDMQFRDDIYGRDARLAAALDSQYHEQLASRPWSRPN